MELLIILGLLLLNGVFAMTEMSIVSAKKSKLKIDADKGDKQAKKVLSIADAPAYFFSAIQVGVTLIGIFLGLYGGQSFIAPLATVYQSTGLGAEVAFQLASITIISIITMLTVVIGELVPKQIAIAFPETVSKWLVFPIDIFARFFTPIVWLFTVMTKVITAALRVKVPEEKVTEEEIKVILKESLEDGEIEQKEHDIIERVFSLDDLRVETLMTPMNQVVALYEDDTIEEVKNKLIDDAHRFYPVYNEDGNEIIGVGTIERLLKAIFDDALSLIDVMEPGFFIPENTTVHNALEQMRKARQNYALVVNEFGMTQGILTLSDIFDALTESEVQDSTIADGLIVRFDGSFLVDGQYPFFELLHALKREDLQEDNFDINTVAGFLLDHFERIPHIGERLEWEGFIFEVVDMDKQRIDKILVSDKK